MTESTDGEKPFGERLNDLIGRAVMGGGEEVTEPVDETHDATGVERVAVEGRNGDVRVRVGDSDVVRVTGEKRTRRGRAALETAHVECVREGETLHVRVRHEDRKRGGVAVDLDVAVPPTVTVTAVETANGDVSLVGTRGDTAVETANGDVTVEDLDGTPTLETVNGTVIARGTAALAGAATVNGDVDVELRAVEAPLDVETVNGSVTLRVGEDLEATLELEALFGAVDTEGVSLVAEGSALGRARPLGGELVCQLGEGGHRVTASTVHGSVRVVPFAPTPL
jgi:DUF4097 and DUF4098 domain-containing protein YvlB